MEGIEAIRAKAIRSVMLATIYGRPLSETHGARCIVRALHMRDKMDDYRKRLEALAA